MRLWGQHLGSYDYYIDWGQQLAKKEGAPIDAIYKRDGEWRRLSEIENKDLQTELLLKLFDYHEKHGWNA